MKYSLDIVNCSVLYPGIQIVKQVRNLFLVVEHDYTVIGHLKCKVVYGAFCLLQRDKNGDIKITKM
jgi:hypothetical protein